MPFAPTILPALDAIRGIGGLLGLRVFKVTVRKRVWTGGRPGLLGTSKTDTDTVLVNQAADGSLRNVRVRQVTRQEVIASGGQYASRDLRVGPVTPSFVAGLLPAGGFNDGTINPAPTASQTEIFWILQSVPDGTAGIPAGGIICELRGEEATSLHYYAILRATGRQPT